MKKVQLLTKGSNPGNAGPAGWSLLLRWSPVGHTPIEKILAGATEEGSANRMELIAAIRGLEALKEPCEVELISESQYLAGIIGGNQARAHQNLVPRLREAVARHTVMVRKPGTVSERATLAHLQRDARAQADAIVVLL